MPYNRKELQIIGGSFNLNPPPDKVPIRDYLLAQNWRIDRDGQLISRYGYPQKFSIAGGGMAHSVGIAGGVEGDWYVATTGANDGSNSLYKSFDPAAIATGFDGRRVGMVYLNGSMFVMNRGRQGRYDGAGPNGAAGFYDWTITPPTSSCHATAAGAPITAGSVTYTYGPRGVGYHHNVFINGIEYWYNEVAADTAAYIALQISIAANFDASVTASHTIGAATVTFTPRASFTAVTVNGSDGNLPATIGTGEITNLPNGTYTFYCTFESADGAIESNPGPASAPVTVAGQGINISNIPVSADSRVGKVNVYVSGGTLGAASGQAYLVGSVANGTTTFTDSEDDATIIDGGVFMPTTNDPPPAASGMCGPYFSRLMAWSVAGHRNRLFWTDPAVPQYWPGAANPSTGNWVDVGDDGEEILWSTMHTNVLVIYKERSIWELIGDPDTGILQRVTDETGLVGQFAVTTAGAVDYFVGPNALNRFDVDRVVDESGNIKPLFNSAITHISQNPLSGPGNIMPGTPSATNLNPYAIALGYAMGKLYVAYTENVAQPNHGANCCLMIYSVTEKRWVYDRSEFVALNAWQGFIFGGIEIVGVTRSQTNNAIGYSLDDFRGFFTAEVGGAPIECVYQSHYEDGGLPDNQKVWLEVVVDITLNGDTATVYVGADGGKTALASVGTTALKGRQSVGFPLTQAAGLIKKKVAGDANPDGFLARNLSVAIVVEAGHQVIIHNVYLYYYEEARLAMEVSSLPVDLGLARMKQAKELALDIDATNGNVGVAIYSDLPGNALAVRERPLVKAGGRAMLRFPFPVEQGYLWRLALTAVTGPFRLYGARLLMRPIGVYVEAYESAAGYVWDSLPMTFDSGLTKIPRQYQIALAALPIKRAREISLEIETFNTSVTVTFLSDLPGDTLANRFSTTVNTGTNGRRFVRIPLPNGLTASGGPFPGGWIEGRMFQIKISGAGTFILYDAAVELIAIGVYIETYEAIAGAVYDSREVDFGIPGVKEAVELELDIETSGAVTPVLMCDQIAPPALPTVSTTGRQKVMLPLTVNAATGQYAEGRLMRLAISGKNAFRLYDAKIRVRAFGQYLLANETQRGALWDSTPLDLGSQGVKQFRALELDIWAYGDYTVTVYTDLPGNVLTSRIVSHQSQTNGRTGVQIPLPQGHVPDNYLYGRLLRVTITSTGAFKLFGARVDARVFGMYVETYEAVGGAAWDSAEQDLGTPKVKQLRELQLEIAALGDYDVTVYTDLPGNAMAQRIVKSRLGTSGRTAVQIPLPQGDVPDNYLYGRLLRAVIQSDQAFALYAARVEWRAIGLYVETNEALGGAVWDSSPTDLGDPRDKQFDALRFDIETDGAATVDVYTDLPGDIIAYRGTFTLTTAANRRRWITVPLPSGLYNGAWGIEGRSIRLFVRSTAGFRIFKAQVRAERTGRYLSAQSGGPEAFSTLEFDFASERIKAFKAVEIDMRVDGTVTMDVLTNQSGVMAVQHSGALPFNLPQGRQIERINLEPGIRGRLLRLSLHSAAAARIYRLRVYARELNEPTADWKWIDYPVEESEMLATWSDLAVAETPLTFQWSDLPVPPTPPQFAWSDLPVPATPPEWQWAPFPVNPTEPQWFWGKVLAVDETPDAWQWVDVNMDLIHG